MATKLDDYLKKAKIDPRRLVVASHDLESLKPEDRAVRLLKKQAKGGNEKAKEAVVGKTRRKGRALSEPALRAALVGKPISPATKSRLVRAVNAVLAQKKKGEAKLKDLF